jgi:hypothetical protein
MVEALSIIITIIDVVNMLRKKEDFILGLKYL